MAGIFAAIVDNGAAKQDGGSCRFELHRFDKASVAFAALGGQRLVRSHGLVSSAGLDHVIVLLCETGTAVTVNREECPVGAGDLVLLDLSRTFALEAGALELIAMVIPRSMLRLCPVALDQLHGSLVEGSSAFGLVLAEHLKVMAKIAPRIGVEEGRTAMTSVGLLVSNTLSTILSRKAKTGGAPLDIELAAIQSFIERNLRQATLTTARISKEFGLSRSALYRVAEPLGGISHYIRNQRLEKARLHLGSVGQGRGSVARLAAKAGFTSEASFARAFKQRFGTSPQEAILLVSKDGGVDQLRHRDPQSLRTWLGLTTLSGPTTPVSVPLASRDRGRLQT